MVVPLMATALFWISATWLWPRTRLQRVPFLIRHLRLGRSICDLLEQGEICRRSKIAALGGVAVGLLMSLLLVTSSLTLVAAVGLMLATVALWIATRPDNRYRRRQPARQWVQGGTRSGRLARAP